MTVHVERLERLKAKLARISTAAKTEMRAANQKSIDEFVAGVRRVVPKSDEAPHLERSLRKGPGRTETEVEASIGDESVPYPAHLEWGHKARDGSHVPAKPFWFTTLRVMSKRFKRRAARAARKAARTA